MLFKFSLCFRFFFKKHLLYFSKYLFFFLIFCYAHKTNCFLLYSFIMSRVSHLISPKTWRHLTAARKELNGRQSHDTAQNSLTDDNSDYEDNKTYETTSISIWTIKSNNTHTHTATFIQFSNSQADMHTHAHWHALRYKPTSQSNYKGKDNNSQQAKKNQINSMYFEIHIHSCIHTVYKQTEHCLYSHASQHVVSMQKQNKNILRCNSGQCLSVHVLFSAMLPSNT